jgi:two-component system chemotaxis response regulator CheY
MKGLVVDSSATMRRIFAHALRGLGCDEIVEATDGKDALSRCDDETAIVVTAWNLDGMTGAELVRELRANPKTANARILMVTARNLKRDVLEAHQAGVNGYLLRPFTVDALRTRLGGLVPHEDDENDGAAGEGAPGAADASEHGPAGGETTDEGEAQAQAA